MEWPGDALVNKVQNGVARRCSCEQSTKWSGQSFAAQAFSGPFSSSSSPQAVQQHQAKEGVGVYRARGEKVGGRGRGAIEAERFD